MRIKEKRNCTVPYFIHPIKQSTKLTSQYLDKMQWLLIGNLSI